MTQSQQKFSNWSGGNIGRKGQTSSSPASALQSTNPEAQSCEWSSTNCNSMQSTSYNITSMQAINNSRLNYNTGGGHLSALICLWHFLLNFLKLVLVSILTIFIRYNSLIPFLILLRYLSSLLSSQLYAFFWLEDLCLKRKTFFVFSSSLPDVQSVLLPVIVSIECILNLFWS